MSVPCNLVQHEAKSEPAVAPARPSWPAPAAGQQEHKGPRSPLSATGTIVSRFQSETEYRGRPLAAMGVDRATSPAPRGGHG